MRGLGFVNVGNWREDDGFEEGNGILRVVGRGRLCIFQLLTELTAALFSGRRWHIFKQ